MKKYFTLFLLLCLSHLFGNAQTSIALQQFSTGYSAIVDIENCGDGRLFIVQESGQIMICDSLGNKRTNAFLDISDRVTYSGEQGLLGAAFDPNYKTNGFFYVDYINKAGNTQISRFKANPDYPNKASAGSEKFILQIAQPFTNHNGGCLRFGPDGYLYIGMGDGGSGGDPNNNAQNPQSLLGKMLRINVHSGNPYSIPADNPFVDSTNYKKEIWALGFRNPWRWSFDSQTGYMVIADVGQDLWEEINYQQGGKGGKNYGWRCYEGNHAYNTAACKPQSEYKPPVYEYEHLSSTGDCAIIGGFVYRGNKYPNLFGKYFCTDYCSGIVRMLSFHGSSSATVAVVYNGTTFAYQAFGEDKKHELYLANNSNGTIYHITDAAAKTDNNFTADNNLSIAPNPSHGSFVATYKSAKAEQISVQIQNTLGQQFYTASKNVYAGINNISLNVHLSKGVYYINIINASGKIYNQQLRIE